MSTFCDWNIPNLIIEEFGIILIESIEKRQ
jgi:hypothetical protein